VLFEGKRATGVEFVQGGQTRQATARAEVILSAGAIGSPQILQCSANGRRRLAAGRGRAGVARPARRRREPAGPPPGAAGVQDPRADLNDEVNNPLNKLWIGMQYMLSRTGPLTLAASQVAIFTRSGTGVIRPDIQFHMQPLSADKPGEGPHRFSAFTSSVCQLRPHSRGRIAIRSADAREYPAIHPGYLSDERDHPVVIGGIKVARRIAAGPSLAPHILSEFVPGEQFQTDAELLDAARRYSQTIYHPAGTCKMGSDPMAVVDGRLRVHGIAGLRVVDASIMPEIVLRQHQCADHHDCGKGGRHDSRRCSVDKELPRRQ
jgi:choline dehydrogenase